MHTPGAWCIPQRSASPGWTQHKGYHLQYVYITPTHTHTQGTKESSAHAADQPHGCAQQRTRPAPAALQTGRASCRHGAGGGCPSTPDTRAGAYRRRGLGDAPGQRTAPLIPPEPPQRWAGCRRRGFLTTPPSLCSASSTPRSCDPGRLFASV